MTLEFQSDQTGRCGQCGEMCNEVILVDDQDHVERMSNCCSAAMLIDEEGPDYDINS